MKSYYDAVKFFQKYSQLPQDILTDEIIYLILRKHVKYNTIIVRYDGDKVIGLARWNLKENTAHVLDCIIHPEHRSFKLIKSMLNEGIKSSKSIKKVVWERKVKYPDREQMIYNVKEK